MEDQDRSRGGFISGEFLWCDPKYLISMIGPRFGVRRAYFVAENMALTMQRSLRPGIV